MTAAIAVAVVGVDQATTSWAVGGLRRPVHLVGPLGLALQYNAGTAFSVFASGGEWLTVVVVVVVVAVAVAAWRARSGLEGVGYGLVIGGALGNLADRFVRGHHGDVVDFVTLSHWPTFNVADACITAGVVVLAAGFLRRTRPTGAERRPERR